MKRKNIAKTEENELLPDYDLSKMRLLKRGPGHANRSKAKVEQMVRVTFDFK